MFQTLLAIFQTVFSVIAMLMGIIAVTMVLYQCIATEFLGKPMRVNGADRQIDWPARGFLALFAFIFGCLGVWGLGCMALFKRLGFARPCSESIFNPAVGDYCFLPDILACYNITFEPFGGLV